MTRTRDLLLPAALLGLLAVAACGPADGTGPAEVRWDRDACERCRMAVSDRSYAAQVRGGPAGERTAAFLFDDLGCAVLWLAEQAWREDPRTEVWVADCESGQWLDGRSCAYLEGRLTPMDFGLGARPASAAAVAGGALDWAAAGERIRERMVEKQATRASCCGDPQGAAPAAGGGR